ncbi:MAG: GGDEF domain-containing protein [Psychrobacter sp.]|nr:GGDEF domain-containing protein [Psychrobacter sp.]
MVWLNHNQLNNYYNGSQFELLWLWVTVAVLFYSWLLIRFNQYATLPKNLFGWQTLLATVYTLHMFITTAMLGYNELMAGVTLVGSAMLAMILIDRKIVWLSFISYFCFILIVSILPFYGVHLPSMRQYPGVSTYHEYYSQLFGQGSPSNLVNQVLLSTKPSTELLDSLSITAKEVAQIKAFKSSQLFWFATYFYFAMPKAIVIVSVFRAMLSIIERNKLNIQYNADHDALTGIKNRRCVLDWIHQTLLKEANVNSDNQHYSVILLDLDSFKAVNDTYGHQVGDQVLKEVAQLLEKAMERQHVVSRYGGEEFLLALPQTSHETALLIAEALKKEIEAMVIHLEADESFQVTASFGVATLPHHEVKRLQATYLQIISADKIKALRSYQMSEKLIRSLIDLADSALYQAKHNGRNQVVSANLLVIRNQVPVPSFELV